MSREYTRLGLFKPWHFLKLSVSIHYLHSSISYEPFEGRRHAPIHESQGLKQCLLSSKCSVMFVNYGMNGRGASRMPYTVFSDNLLITYILTALNLNLHHCFVHRKKVMNMRYCEFRTFCFQRPSCFPRNHKTKLLLASSSKNYAIKI